MPLSPPGGGAEAGYDSAPAQLLKLQPRRKRTRPPPTTHDNYCTITCTVNKAFVFIVFLVAVLGSGLFTTIFLHSKLGRPVSRPDWLTGRAPFFYSAPRLSSDAPDDIEERSARNDAPAPGSFSQWNSYLWSLVGGSKPADGRSDDSPFAGSSTSLATVVSPEPAATGGLETTLANTVGSLPSAPTVPSGGTLLSAAPKEGAIAIVGPAVDPSSAAEADDDESAELSMSGTRSATRSNRPKRAQQLAAKSAIAAAAVAISSSGSPTPFVESPSIKAAAPAAVPVADAEVMMPSTAPSSALTAGPLSSAAAAGNRGPPSRQQPGALRASVKAVAIGGAAAAAATSATSSATLAPAAAATPSLPAPPPPAAAMSSSASAASTRSPAALSASATLPATSPSRSSKPSTTPAKSVAPSHSVKPSQSGSRSLKPSHSMRPSVTCSRSVKPSKRVKPPGPFGGLVVNASSISGSCNFTACPNRDTASPWRDKPYRIHDTTKPASSIPYIYTIVNHRNRFSNLNRLVASIQNATAHDPVLRACMCIILVDYDSRVEAIQADLRATCVPAWDSLAPIPGTLGADLYLDARVQDATYTALLGTFVHTDNVTGIIASPPNASLACERSVYGLTTAAALQQSLSPYSGDSMIVNATPYFDSFSRAGLLSLGMASIRTMPVESLVFLADSDMYVRPGWFEEMLAFTIPGKQVYFPIVWSACYGANVTTFPVIKSHPSGKESRGWWREKGTGMVVTYMKDMYRCGGYGQNFMDRGVYGTEDWGLEHRIRRYVRVYRQHSVTLMHPHHAQNRNWQASIDGMRSVRTGKYQCITAAGDPCGCPKSSDASAGIAHRTRLKKSIRGSGAAAAEAAFGQQVQLGTAAEEPVADDEPSAEDSKAMMRQADEEDKEPVVEGADEQVEDGGEPEGGEEDAPDAVVGDASQE